MPVLLASRRANNSYYTSTTSGIGDSALVAQGWLWNPRHAKRGNISIGFGLQAPSGKDNVQNNVLTSATATTPTVVTDDYSIQPGSGGWGMVFQWQAFRDVGNNTTIYTNGNYLATQGGYNNVLRSATALSQPLTAYNAIQDQYLLQAGVAHAISRIKGLSVTFGPRVEGSSGKQPDWQRPRLPAARVRDFRRAWFHLWPRPEHNSGQHRKGTVYRDRTRSVPDKMLGAHGDAAFADYVWLLSYSYRIPGRNHTTESN